MCEFYAKLRVNGVKNMEEKKWAERIGMKSYHKVVHNVINPIIIPVYNKIWKLLDKDLVVDPEDENCTYNRIYNRIFQALINFVLLVNGGYNFKTKRKIYVKTFYTMLVEEDHYIIDDMIFVKDFWD